MQMFRRIVLGLMFILTLSVMPVMAEETWDYPDSVPAIELGNDKITVTTACDDVLMITVSIFNIDSPDYGSVQVIILRDDTFSTKEKRAAIRQIMAGLLYELNNPQVVIVQLDQLGVWRCA